MLNQIPTDFGIPAESQFQGFGINDQEARSEPNGSPGAPDAGGRGGGPPVHRRARHQQGAKIANATSYGIFVELNVEDYVAAKPMIGYGLRTHTKSLKL